MMLVIILRFPTKGQANTTVITIPEGADFATLVLGDPWDMSEYSDVSQYINVAGQTVTLSNISVQNGVFSARGLQPGGAQFTVLFPGYNTAMLIGKVGELYPIDRARFNCVYMAAKVDSAAVNGSSVLQPDFWLAHYFANEKLNGPGGLHGVALQRLYGNVNNPTPSWRLHKINLVDDYRGDVHWTESASWKGLRIDPSSQATSFAIDWVRLTDCQARNFNVTGLTNNKTYSFYLVSGGREILISTFTASGTSANVDLQGAAAGAYTYRVKEGSSLVREGELVINQTPVVKFNRPSPSSGEDFATTLGDPWDFSNAGDVASSSNLSTSFNGGFLDMVTDPQKDAILELKTPAPMASASEYRYLTFRMYTQGAWQNVPFGMIARWIWRIPNASFSGDCWFVSNDMPFDVGWQTISIDLQHAFNGSAEETHGDCGSFPMHWTQEQNIHLFRFDPNENITGAPLVQKLDWIRLTKVDQVKRGTAFPIEISLNKPKDNVDIDYYYTTDRASPKQHQVDLNASTGSDSPLPTFAGPYRAFLAAVLHGSLPITATNASLWDTSGVAAGVYYICAESRDGYNTSVYCSEAPVKINP